VSIFSKWVLAPQPSISHHTAAERICSSSSEKNHLAQEIFK